MNIHTSVVDELPEYAKQSARHSACQDLVELAIARAPKYVQVSADTSDELVRFYKSLIQYKKRHTEYNFNLRKNRNALYLWVTADSEVQS